MIQELKDIIVKCDEVLAHQVKFHTDSLHVLRLEYIKAKCLRAVEVIHDVAGKAYMGTPEMSAELLELQMDEDEENKYFPERMPK